MFRRRSLQRASERLPFAAIIIFPHLAATSADQAHLVRSRYVRVGTEPPVPASQPSRFAPNRCAVLKLSPFDLREPFCSCVSKYTIISPHLAATSADPHVLPRTAVLP